MAIIPEPFIRQNYAGLNDSEDRLLRQYLRTVEADIQGIETAVELGPGEVLPEFRDDTLRNQWQRSSKLKADVIVETRGEIQLVELKDFIRTSALGQLLNYRYWHSIERDPQKPVQMVVTGPDINPSVVQPLRFHNVEITVQTISGENHLAQGETASPPFNPF